MHHPGQFDGLEPALLGIARRLAQVVRDDMGVLLLLALHLLREFPLRRGRPKRKVLFAIPPRKEASAEDVFADLGVLVLKDLAIRAEVRLQQVLKVDTVKLVLPVLATLHLVLLDLAYFQERCWHMEERSVSLVELGLVVRVLGR